MAEYVKTGKVRYVIHNCPLTQPHTKVLGLDTQQFDQCLTSGKYKTEIQSEVEVGRKLGVIGTPTFFLGRTGNDSDRLKATRQIGGAYPYTAFKQAIDDILSSAMPSPDSKAAARSGEQPAKRAAEQARPGG